MGLENLVYDSLEVVEKKREIYNDQIKDAINEIYEICKSNMIAMHATFLIGAPEGYEPVVAEYMTPNEHGTPINFSIAHSLNDGKMDVAMVTLYKLHEATCSSCRQLSNEGEKEEMN